MQIVDLEVGVFEEDVSCSGLEAGEGDDDVLDAWALGELVFGELAFDEDRAVWVYLGPGRDRRVDRRAELFEKRRFRLPDDVDVGHVWI
jgi:hypothetical protein